MPQKTSTAKSPLTPLDFQPLSIFNLKFAQTCVLFIGTVHSEAVNVFLLLQFDRTFWNFNECLSVDNCFEELAFIVRWFVFHLNVVWLDVVWSDVIWLDVVRLNVDRSNIGTCRLKRRNFVAFFVTLRRRAKICGKLKKKLRIFIFLCSKFLEAICLKKTLKTSRDKRSYETGLKIKKKSC